MARTPNLVKREVKLALEAKCSAEVVKKGIARGECWMRAAFGGANAEAYGQLDEPVKFFELYCNEVVSNLETGSDRTMNKTTFGIYGSGRRS